MNKTIAPLALAALLAFHPTVQARSAADEWKTLNAEVKALYQAGRYDRAIVVAQQALRVAEQNVGLNHPDVAQSLDNLAALYRATQRDTQAEPLERRAAAIRAIPR